ncbi:glycosyltransferase [Microbacterium sp. dk485]|uniref:glycosyltransferase n=1 Tax=Microbacterium sp. dk485 TaxID=2560021 RepID=UPI0010730CB9|nr:glycosyltransferase [Microbacterium sp. dk485]TFV80995.1 glycosyltransferase [Microbacterium sp. dk485]
MNAPQRITAEYVLPLKWSDEAGVAELTDYLHRLVQWIDVTVVDGSDPDLFAAHAAAWGDAVRHVPVAVRAGANGKVRGVLTGIAAARHERIVLADDDVRYDAAALARVVAALADADLVKPQNHFRPLPWHARWDTGRTLINRALGGDYPGTYGVRRSALTATGGYDAGVLFENLEMERTVRAGGGRVRALHDLYVVRRPPSIRHFLGQRVRQAYDSLAQPGRLVAELAILPALLLARRRRAVLAALAGAAIVIGEVGRRRGGGARVFPPTAALWAPAWVLERGVTVWAALILRARGGVRYAGDRLSRAATSNRILRARHAPARAQY